MCGIENIKVLAEVNGRLIHSLVYFIQGLSSQVFLSNKDRTVNAKSILGVLSLGLVKGDSIQISVVNDDIDIANDELKKIIEYFVGLGEVNE